MKMLVACKNNGRFLKNKVVERVCLVNANYFHDYNACSTNAAAFRLLLYTYLYAPFVINVTRGLCV